MDKSIKALIVLIGCTCLFLLVYPFSSDDNSNTEHFVQQNTTYNSSEFDACFSSLDLDTNLPSIGCVNTFYSLLDENTVLVTNFLENEYFLGCKTLKFEKQGTSEIKLQTYKDGKAHLDNRCTCMINIKAPKPIKEYSLESGIIIIGGKHSKISSWKEGVTLKSILFEEAIFSTIKGEKVRIKNKYFLNAQDIGPSG